MRTMMHIDFINMSHRWIPGREIVPHNWPLYRDRFLRLRDFKGATTLLVFRSEIIFVASACRGRQQRRCCITTPDVRNKRSGTASGRVLRARARAPRISGTFREANATWPMSRLCQQSGSRMLLQVLQQISRATARDERCAISSSQVRAGHKGQLRSTKVVRLTQNDLTRLNDKKRSANQCY